MLFIAYILSIVFFGNLYYWLELFSRYQMNQTCIAGLSKHWQAISQVEVDQDTLDKWSNATEFQHLEYATQV